MVLSMVGSGNDLLDGFMPRSDNNPLWVGAAMPYNPHWSLSPPLDHSSLINQASCISLPHFLPYSQQSLPSQNSYCVPDAEARIRQLKKSLQGEEEVSKTNFNLSKDSSAIAMPRGGKMTSLGASPKCNVCSQKPNEARVITFCGHLFCWPCLCCWLHNKSPDKECPVCNRPLTKDHITPLHGRQNSLTVARLQGMLKTEKTSSRSQPHARGEGTRRNHQAKISSSSSSSSSAAAPSNSSVPINPSNDGKSLAHPLIMQTAPLISGNMIQKNLESFPAQFQQGSKFLPPLTISTSSTVVTTTSCTNNVSFEIPDMKNMVEPMEGSQKIKELGILLSLEWECAMSAIENAWWNALCSLYERSRSKDNEHSIGVSNSSSSSSSNSQHTAALTARMSKEKEAIIQELSSEPLEGMKWLPERLKVFKRIASEIDRPFDELSFLSSNPWLTGSCDVGMDDVFPELNINCSAEFEDPAPWIGESSWQPQFDEFGMPNKLEWDQDTTLMDSLC